jgi:hypothetical protein
VISCIPVWFKSHRTDLNFTQRKRLLLEMFAVFLWRPRRKWDGKRRVMMGEGWMKAWNHVKTAKSNIGAERLMHEQTGSMTANIKNRKRWWGTCRQTRPCSQDTGNEANSQSKGADSPANKELKGTSV